MPRELGADRIEVNIPDYAVRVFHDGRVVDEHRVVVGKTDTPTPLFSNAMKYLIVNPYWNVPQSIIKKEMLPKGGGSLAYLEGRGYDVGYHNGMATVKQLPGPKNALGQIKFLFPNDFSVYLHDTPSKSLFRCLQARFQSRLRARRQALRLCRIGAERRRARGHAVALDAGQARGHGRRQGALREPRQAAADPHRVFHGERRGRRPDQAARGHLRLRPRRGRRRSGRTASRHRRSSRRSRSRQPSPSARVVGPSSRPMSIRASSRRRRHAAAAAAISGAASSIPGKRHQHSVAGRIMRGKNVTAKELRTRHGSLTLVSNPLVAIGCATARNRGQAFASFQRTWRG